MRSAVTVSLVPETRGGPFVFSAGLADACAHAAELGFDAIEIFPPAGNVAELDAAGDLLARHDLRVAAMGTGAGWVLRQLTLTHRDESVRREACRFIRGIIERAANWGAPAIIGSMQGRWERGITREQALRWLGEGLDELGEHAARLNVPLLFEPLNRYETNLFNRLGDTAAWLRMRRTQNVRILADLFHMNIDEANSAAAIREAGALLGHVHFADSNRRAMGFGQTPLPPIIAALRAVGFAGYLSAEILPLPDPLTAARQTIDAFRQSVAQP